MRILKNHLLFPSLVALSLSAATAQSNAVPTTFVSPAPGTVLASLNGPTLWGGFSSELVILPELFAGFSTPLGQNNGLTYSLRGTAEATLGLAALGADVLFSRAPNGLYGGPSAAVIFGQEFGYLAGGVIGYRNQDRERIGFFLEGKLRYLVLREAVHSHEPPAPGQPDRAPSDFTFPSPGLRFGLTYRF
ncbi:hypothetical protein [Deinococcus navajonensis]|uniref:Outer membrane protein beta-barrel domain-containing protein n=1 Tax=Deinococcus navajonensis TaxID=309884 RepID=A0ABV8XJS6_9DEIO